MTKSKSDPSLQNLEAAAQGKAEKENAKEMDIKAIDSKVRNPIFS